jgi:2-polyprenyl-6-methoxyphenol hydroxylase-like FAD-dependent oxidoreductase
MGQLMTSWGLIHQALRSMFPKDRYYEGTPLEDFERTDHGVAAGFAGLGQIQPDLLIGVDGSRSLVRQKLVSLPFSRLGNFSFHSTGSPKLRPSMAIYERMKIYA